MKYLVDKISLDDILAEVKAYLGGLGRLRLVFGEILTKASKTSIRNDRTDQDLLTIVRQFLKYSPMYLPKRDRNTITLDSTSQSLISSALSPARRLELVKHLQAFNSKLDLVERQDSLPTKLFVEWMSVQLQQIETLSALTRQSQGLGGSSHPPEPRGRGGRGRGERGRGQSFKAYEEAEDGNEIHSEAEDGDETHSLAEDDKNKQSETFSDCDSELGFLCPVCDSENEHPLWFCQYWKNKSLIKNKLKLKLLFRCLKCFNVKYKGQYHTCPSFVFPWVCSEHDCNRAICVREPHDQDDNEGQDAEDEGERRERKKQSFIGKILFSFIPNALTLSMFVETATK